MSGRFGGSIGAGTNVLVLAAADRTGARCTTGRVSESDRSTVAVVYGRRDADLDGQETNRVETEKRETKRREGDGWSVDGRGGPFRGYVTVDPPLATEESTMRAEIVDGEHGDSEGDSVVETIVSSPRDLAGLWVAIGLYLEELTARGDRAIVRFDSLTALCASVTPDRACRFVRLLVGRLRRANVDSHFHLDPDRCDPGTVAEFRSLFDATVSETAEPTPPPRRRASAIAALATPERRCVVEHLLETGGEATLRELAARLVAEDRIDDGIETVRLALYHDHLPRLAEADLVTVDARTGAVSLAANGAELEWLAGDVRGGTRSAAGDRR